MKIVSEQEQKRASYWLSVWRRFKSNKMAFVGLIFIIIITVAAIFTPWIAPHSYDETNYAHTFEKPSWQFIWGTDDLGRDMFSRNLYAMRNALLIGFGSQAIVVVVGVIIGAIAGFRGGTVDSVLMRIVDIMYAFPTFLFNVILVTALGRGIPIILLAIGITGWAGMARLVRGMVMSLKNADFVEAARALGAKEFHIIRKYILPNMFGPIIVSIAFGIPNAIWMESGLALVGMGVRPPMPSWGNMISAGMGYIMAFPHMVIFPAILFALTLLAFTYVGDGLRDAMNPKGEA